MPVISVGDLFAARYRVLRELGSGGMAYVFAARDEELDETVALKIIRPDFADHEDFVERFKREVRIARQIHHENVVRVLEFGAGVVGAKRVYYLTMEYLEGCDLAEEVKESELSVRDAVRIAVQICDGLGAAHRAGVVHRDIKPQNIFIERSGRVKIMDFGISRLASLPSLTTAGQLVGTPKYMSPEQVHRRSEPDARSDIYSLGVLLYELVTRYAPFSGQSTGEIALHHLETEPPSPRELNSHIPPKLEEVILTCLAKEREDRFQSVSELRAALGSVPLTKPRRDPWKPLAIGASVTAVAVVGAILLPGSKPEAPTLDVAMTAESSTTTSSTRPVTQETQPKGAPVVTTSSVRATSSVTTTTALVRYRVRFLANLEAQIYLDGVLLGSTEVDREIAAGVHELRFSVPQYAEHVESIDVVRGGQSFSHRFAAPGSLRVTAQPYARVLLDGEDLGTTPVQLEKVAEGEHALVLERDGFERIEQRVMIEPGQVNRFQFRMARVQ